MLYFIEPRSNTSSVRFLVHGKGPPWPNIGNNFLVVSCDTKTLVVDLQQRGLVSDDTKNTHTDANSSTIRIYLFISQRVRVAKQRRRGRRDWPRSGFETPRSKPLHCWLAGWLAGASHRIGCCGGPYSSTPPAPRGPDPRVSCRPFLRVTNCKEPPETTIDWVPFCQAARRCVRSIRSLARSWIYGLID